MRATLADPRSEDAAHTVFDTGTIDGHDVVLAGSGMGKVNAALVTTLLADRFGCRAVVFSGVAGGLDPSLSIGEGAILPWSTSARMTPRPRAPGAVMATPSSTEPSGSAGPSSAG